jgi:hypothetical protein
MECLMKMLACDEQAVATLDSLHDTRRAEQLTFLRSQPVENNDFEDPLDLRIASIRSLLERESQNDQADEFDEGRSSKRVRHPALALSNLLRQRWRLIHAHRPEITFYGFSAALAIVLGWLITHLA